MHRECFDAIKSLRSNDKIIITKPDKSSGVVILNKSDHITKTNLTLNDAGKFQPIDPSETMITLQRSNQIFHYTRCITPKRETNWWGPSPRHCAIGSSASSEEISQRRQAVSKTVSDLTGPRFEPWIFRSRDKRDIARPTGRYTAKIEAKIQRHLLQLSNGGVMHESIYKEIRPTGSLRPRLYGLPNVHKTIRGFSF